MASGRNTRHAANRRDAAQTSLAGAQFRGRRANDRAAPPIDTTRLTAEFGQVTCDLAADLPTLLHSTEQEVQCSPSTRPWPRDHPHADGSAEEHGLDTPEAFEAVSAAWLRCGWDVKYVYGFTWMGRPVIQLPEDMIRIQEVIWRVRPDVIVETGVAHGGSLVFYASLFEAMGHGRVIGVDIDIRSHNRTAIEAHPMASRITLVAGQLHRPARSPRSGTASRRMNACWWCSTPTIAARTSRPNWICTRRSSRPAPTSLRATASWHRSPAHRAPRPTGPGTIRSPPSRHSCHANPDFVLEEPAFPFNEGKVRNRVTYWPKSFLRRDGRA